MIPNYERKLLYLWKKQGGRCAITGKLLTLACKIDMHHVLPDTKVNRKLYKLYINSVWNLALVSHDAHMTKPLPKRPDEWEVFIAEEILKRFPGIEYRMGMEEALGAYVRGEVKISPSLTG